MNERRYHHGDLRTALLARAETTLRESGVDGLSLRDLARSVGVSHGAPRRHFEDKAALLKALVAEGFHRLGEALAKAVLYDGEFGAVLKEVVVTYIDFATSNPALVDLMSASRYLADADDALVRARDISFAPVRRLVETGQSTGRLAPGDVTRIGTLIFATVHGLAMMANNKMIDSRDDQLISAAIHSMLTGLGPGPRESSHSLADCGVLEERAV